MRPEVKRVKEFVEAKWRRCVIDTDVLIDCVDALSPIDKDILRRGADKDALDFVAKRVFYRHNDVCQGITNIVKSDSGYTVEICSQSAISELNIEYATLVDCNKNYIYKISDLNKEILPELSLEAIADVTRAILEYQSLDTVETESVPIEVDKE